MYLEWETKFPISGRASRAVGPLVMVRQLPSLRLRRQMRNWLSCKARVYSKSWTQKNLDPSGVRRLCLSFWLSDLACANSLINLWSSASMQALDEREWKKGWSLDQQQHEDSQDDSLPTLTTAHAFNKWEPWQHPIFLWFFVSFRAVYVWVAAANTVVVNSPGLSKKYGLPIRLFIHSVGLSWP